MKLGWKEALWLGIAACRGDKDEVIASLEGDWACENSSGHSESFELSTEPLSLSVEQVRQVGIEGDRELPYPTICRFLQRSTSLEVSEGSEFDWILSYEVDSVELVEDVGNTEHCGAFIDRENTLAADGLDYSFSFNVPVWDTLKTDSWTCSR